VNTGRRPPAPGPPPCRVLCLSGWRGQATIFVDGAGSVPRWAPAPTPAQQSWCAPSIGC